MKGARLDIKRRAGRGAARRPGRAEVVRDKTQDRAEAGRTIQGQPASDIEWATYCALRSLGWTDNEVGFQVSIYGGRVLIGGGQVLDFVVSSGASNVVIDVRGARYHGAQAGKAARDRWRELRVQAAAVPPRYVVIWEDVGHNWQRLRAQLLREVGAR